MDYKEKYEKALEWMKSIYPTMQGSDKEDAEHYFPELAESEDEKIRKELLFHIQSEIDTYDNMISGDYDSRDKEDKKVHNMLKRAKTYLEKQKERKNFRKLYEDIAQSEWFKKAYVGKSLGEEQKPAELTPLADLLSNYLKNDFEFFATKKWDEKKWNEVMNIQASELLRYAKKELEKEQKPDNPNIQKVDPDIKITTSDSSASGDELLYVSNKSYNIGYRDGKREAESKQEWSEEDETCLEYALWCVMKTRHFVAKDACDLDACRCAERWLKSLCPQPKPEWSKEEKK